MGNLSLKIAGHEFEVSRVDGRVALSELFRFDVWAATAEAPPAIADLLGQKFTLTIHDGFDRQVDIAGLCTAVKRNANARMGGGYALTLEPEAAKLAVGQDSRVFQELSAVDIVKKVLSDGGVDTTKWSVSGSYPTRPYTAQYRESDWAFIERLCAEEGIYYWFELGEDQTTLVFADDSTTAPELDGGAGMPYGDESGGHSTRDTVTRVGKESRIAVDAVTLRDYNFDKPRLKLEAKAGSGKHEVFDFPGRFSTPSDGDRLAKRRLEGLNARKKVVFGRTPSTRLRAGLVFELTDHPVESLNGRYLVESVIYRAADHRDGGHGEAQGMSIEWTAIPAATPYRPERTRVVESSGGPQTGVVSGAKGEEIHPDKSGRIRVQLYWDRQGKQDDKASTWMRVGQFPLGGSMILPRIGWEVLVHHHDGDVDQPFVSTHLYDGRFPVPYALPANKTRTAWQTATTPGGGSTNEIRFEDKAGSEEVFMNASKDMNTVVGDNKGEKIGVDHTVKIGSNHQVKIGSNLKVGIKSNQDVSIGASESLTVSGGRTVSVGGSETASIGASRSVTASGGSSIEAKGGRSLTVGGSMMAASALGVNRAVLGSLSVTVGGSWISAAAAGVAGITGGAAAETIGGAKIMAGAAGCKTSVKGACAETVGGAYVIAAGGKVEEAATGTLAFTVGGAFLANAPTIEAEADSEISIRCGGSTLTITSSSVEIKAPLIAAPGAMITKKASSIKHN